MRIILFFFLVLAPLLAKPQAKRALSLIEKDKTAEAIELLQKGIEKDSLAPAEKFVKASVLFTLGSEYYNLDSAYFYCLEAISDFDGTELREQGKLIDDDFSPDVFDSLKSAIESAGLQRAKMNGTEQDYIDFIDQFPTAVLIDSAILLRNEEAFRIAAAQHTYQSYQEFFTKYPDAVDLTEAKKRYEKLLFEEKTKSGKLKDYQTFLRTYPETYHRQEAELAIFNIITGRNTFDAYQSFLDQYPESYLRNRAIIQSFALLPKEARTNFIGSNILSKSQVDSIKLLAGLSKELLVLSIQDGHPQIINAKGEVVLTNLTKIYNGLNCADSIELLITGVGGYNQLMNLTGSVITEGDLTRYSLDATGLIKLTSPKGVKFIHSTGLATTGKIYKNATMVGPFIAFEQNSKWGLESITGIKMIEAGYDSIALFHEHLIFTNDGKWGVMSFQELHPLLDKAEVDIKLPYDGITVLRKDRLLIERESEAALADENIEPIVSFRVQSIELVDNGYFLETNDSILDSRLSSRWYSDIRSNDRWTIAMRKDSTDIYFKGVNIVSAEDAELVGNTAVLVTYEDKSYCYFTDSSKIEMAEGDIIKPVRRMGQNSTIRHYLYTDSRNKQSVIDQYGNRVDIPRFDKLIDLGDDYMIFSVKGFVYNILDNEGDIVLKNVDAATPLSNGYISFLADGRFGLLNSLNNSYIRAKYDKPVRSFADSLFIVELEGNMGLVNRIDSIVLPIRFNDIRMLNDSIAVTSSNFRWSFWNLNSGKLLLDNVSDYWEYDLGGHQILKVFKGIGYGIWSADKGIILNPTFSEVNIRSRGDQVMYIGEKWIEEADLVVLLYYDKSGELMKKAVISTAEYQTLACSAEG